MMLKFFYNVMNSGKTTTLIQTAYNYLQRNIPIIILNSSLDNRFSDDCTVSSRTTLSLPAEPIEPYDLNKLNDIIYRIENEKIKAIFIDEAQFLSKKQVDFLANIVDNYKIDIYCYGIHTDFEGNLFEGAARLFAISDVIEKINTISLCDCGEPATMNRRLIESDEQIVIGSEDIYDTCCRECYFNHKIGK